MFKLKHKKNNMFLKAIFMALFCVALMFCGFAINLDANASVNYNSSQPAKYTWQYEQFIGLSEEEKSTYGVLPRMYEVSSEALYTSKSYNNLLSSSQPLPSEYTLFDNDSILKNFSYSNLGNNAKLPVNVGNQQKTNICWAYAALTSFETSLYKMDVVDTSSPVNFSELDLAYTTLVANRGASKISGGTFDLAYEYLSSGQGPVFEQLAETNTGNINWSSDSYATSFYANNFYGKTTHSGYSALEACYYPARTSLDAVGKQDLRNSIKNHIKTYGAVAASIYMDRAYMFENVYYNYYGSQVANHAVTLVGWDDDISYTLSNGVTYTGAYIAQNSYGADYCYNGYFYIMYDDVNVEENMSGFVRVDEALSNNLLYNNLDGTKYDNQFITMLNNYTYYLSLDVESQENFVNFYQVKDVENQYISRIKIPTVMSGEGGQSKFYVYVLNNLTSAQVATDNNIKDTLSSSYSQKTKIKNIHAKSDDDQYLFVSQQNTFYTIEVGNQISLEGDYFAICVEYVEGKVYFKDNVDEEVDGWASNQKTYKSSNGSSWQNYKALYSINEGTKLGTCTLPMYVETEYVLGTIKYSKLDVDQVYSANYFSAEVVVTEPSNYTILYSLDNQTWSSNNYSFKNASQDAYTVYFKIIADFYKTVVDSVTVNIYPKELKVYPIEGQYKFYYDYDSTIDQGYQGNINGEKPKFSGKFERQSGEEVGKYLISLGSKKLVDNDQFLASNYNLVFDSTKKYYYEIKPRNLYVEVELTGKIYGESDPDVYYIAYSNAAQYPNFTGLLAREQGEDVGLYDVYQNTLALADNDESGFKASNYKLVFDQEKNSNKFEIVQRQLIIVPDSNIQKVYNTSDPEFTFTYINNVGDEVPAFNGALSRESGEDAGQYTYTIGSLSLKDNSNFKANNYKLALTSEEIYFVINYGTLTGCQVEGREVFYDGTVYTLLPKSTTEEDVAISYSLDQINWQVGLPSYKDVGEYLIYFKFEKLNFNPVTLSATLKIKPHNLYIEPNKGQYKIYGENDPQIAFTFTNPLLSVDEVPSYTGDLLRLQGEDVGSYLIDGCNIQLKNNGSFKASNYRLIYNNLDNITFNIVPREIVLTPNQNQFKTYGKVDPSLTFTISNLAFNQVPSTKGSLTREAGETVGKYKIGKGDVELDSATNFNKGNYILTFNSLPVEFEIVKANITLQVGNKQTYYGDPLDFDFECTITGDYVQGDNLNIEYYCEVDSGSVMGDYPILANAQNPNYQITVLSGIYHIEFKTFEVKFYALGSFIKSVSVKHFSLINTHQIPVVEQDGYEFDCWEIVNDDNSYRSIDIYSYQVESDLSLTARMRIKTYNIYMHTNNDENEVIKKSYTIRDNDITLDFVKKQGHTFENWYDNASFEGEPVTKVQSGSFGDKHFYAKWTVNTYQIDLPTQIVGYQIDCLDNSLTQLYNKTFKFKIVLSEEYSQSLSTIKVYKEYNNGTSKDEIEKDENDYYTIANVINNYQIVVEGVNLNTYSIDFVVDQDILKTIVKQHGQLLDISEYPQIPQKQNYDDILPYWDMDNGILSVTDNATINAVYIPNVYDVIIVVNDKKINKKVTYGSQIDIDEIREELDLNMFEYLVFDKSLTDIDSDSVINAKVESNIYILYICLGSLGGFIFLTVLIIAIRKHRSRKFKWWEYAKHSDDSGSTNKK